MEAAAWSLQVRPDPKLEATLDELTDTILAAQEPSGYLNTWFVEDRAPLRWQQQVTGHELYCLGHLLQAGIAYYRSTGKRKLLDGGIRFVEYLLRDFGPAPKQPLLTGHPELELALAELYRTTGDRRYLGLAEYLFSGVERERLKLRERDLVYIFSGKPFTERTQLEGHAVRALYASAGAADYVLETGNEAFRSTILRLWEDLAFRKMYVTGGVGSRAAGETFGDAYELPNQQAYTESCAAIAGMLFNQRLLHLTGEANGIFADRSPHAGRIEAPLADGATPFVAEPGENRAGIAARSASIQPWEIAGYGHELEVEGGQEEPEVSTRFRNRFQAPEKEVVKRGVGLTLHRNPLD